jgi:hypothetical protein
VWGRWDGPTRGARICLDHGLSVNHADVTHNGDVQGLWTATEDEGDAVSKVTRGASTVRCR